MNVFHCVGIKPEREALNLRIEDYQAKISAAFKRASKEQGFGPSLGKVMVEAFDYHGLEIVSVRLPAITEPIAYKGEIYVRDGSHMVPVDRAHFFAFSEDFRKKIDAARNADTLNSLRKP